MLLAEGQILENTIRFESNTVAAPYGVGPQGIANRDDSASIKFVGTVITFTGTMAISGAISLPNGSAAAPSLNFTNSATTGLYRSAANTIGIAVSGALDFSVSANSLNVLTGSNVALADSAQVRYGDAADIAMTWDGTKFAITQAAANSAIDMGVDGAGIDVIFRGDTAGAAMTWDQSADALAFTGTTKVTGIRMFPGVTPPAIVGVTALSLLDSGGVFSVSQAAAYDIDLPDPTTAGGTLFDFYLTGPAANSVTITVAGGAATFVGTIVNDVTSVLPCTGSTLTFVSGVAALGDNIQIRSIGTNLYLVRAVCSANGGITIT